MKRAMMAALLFLGQLMAASASAETQEHGAFSVIRKQTTEGISCKLMVGQGAEEKQVFLLSLTQDAGQMFIALYVSNLDQLRGHEVSFQIDRHEIMHFKPPKAGDALIGIHVEMDDERMQQALKEAAGDVGGGHAASSGGHVLEVVTDDFRFALPATGFKEAVADYLGCRHDRSL